MCVQAKKADPKASVFFPARVNQSPPNSPEVAEKLYSTSGAKLNSAEGGSPTWAFIPGAIIPLFPSANRDFF